MVAGTGTRTTSSNGTGKRASSAAGARRRRSKTDDDDDDDEDWAASSKGAKGKGKGDEDSSSGSDTDEVSEDDEDEDEDYSASASAKVRRASSSRSTGVRGRKASSASTASAPLSRSASASGAMDVTALTTLSSSTGSSASSQSTAAKNGYSAPLVSIPPHLLTASGPTLSGQRSKSVVFSQFTTFLDVIACRLVEEGISYVRLDGSMPAPAREAAVRSFQTNPHVHVFLVSLKAGGTGLTLTAGCSVFITDVYWSPAVQDQACDRVHRLGQSSAVDVYLLVAAGTIEENIVMLQERKRAVAAGAFSGVTREQMQKMRLDDLRLLMSTE